MPLKRLLFLLLLGTLMLLLGRWVTQSPPADRESWNPKDFKVVAYSSEIPFDDPIESLRFDKMTHIVYAFVIPEADGTLRPLQKPERLRSLIRKAHAADVHVSVALGGWSSEGTPLGPVFRQISMNPETRTRLVRNIAALLDRYGLDGLELDWEYPTTEQDAAAYEALVIALDRELTARGRSLTAAVSGSFDAISGTDLTRGISDNALRRFDWITIMAYDLYGQDPSPLWYADTSLAYWKNRGVPAQKLVLGLPLFARPSWRQYRELVQADPDNAWRDSAATEPLPSRYNGLATLKEKTRRALLDAGGVMLFDIHEDTLDYTSALYLVDTLKQDALRWSPDVFRNAVTLVVNGRQIRYQPDSGLGIPFITPEGRLLVPAKRTLEALGATVAYDPYSGTVRIGKPDIAMNLSLRGRTCTLNGRPLSWPPETVVLEGRLYLPARDLFRHLGYTLEWLPESRTLLIRD